MVLKALILVGGYGTRLRPLTFTKPKPLVPFINKPIVKHQIEALVEVGVREIIFAVCHKPKMLEEELEHIASKLKIQIHFTLEKEPMGTGGPIQLNSKLLDINDPDPFFMLNADVIADYDFDQLLQFHSQHGKEGSIYVTPVEDPSRYGVVVSDSKGQVSQFKEKPKDSRFGNCINAGLYLFNKSIINRVQPNRKTSIEREIFPAMAKAGELYMCHLKGYWMDVGKPKDFINGQKLYLNSIATKNDDRIVKGNNIRGAVVIHNTANVSRTAVIGPNVVIGPNCQIGHNVRIKDSCIFQGSQVSDAAFISGSIVGWKNHIGKWARIQESCVLGEDVTVKSEVCLVGVTVCPHKTCSTDNYKESDEKIIL